MAFHSGQDGQLFIDGKRAGKVISWNYAASMAVLDTTTLGDRDATKTAGIRTHGGAVELFYYAEKPTDTTTNSASVLINKLIKASSNGQGAKSEEVKLKLVINDGTATGKFIEGNAWLTNAAISMAVGEVLRATVQYQFNGAPTEMLL
ncbi:MAG: hypothetical protein CMA72_08725 [Euryarchaeota archaeon]|nr:hypothetical protein [Euryarchaeota archaeon]|tara:strand:+ start:6135 stop:6578 length:444 start_codon:yes stop_codon:yes gene_type:complete